jgi:cytochrome d ubiquinol oxidase subunit I
MESLLDYGVLLARIQFAFTVSFHIIFPAFTIGVSAFVATLLVMHQWTGREHYRVLARMWTKIFAVSFAMGVVSGIVLSYQFGTNWSRFSVVVGNVIGPLIGYEVLTAFFLEATFLGILLFGWNRVPSWLHTLAAIAVAIGTAISMFWILSANSWMHTPAGFEMRDGVAYPLDWSQIIFNPSFPTRFAHMGIAAYLTVSLVVLAIGARYLLARVHEVEARTMMRMGAGMLLVLAPLQVFVGDLSGLVMAKYQPAKVAAVEAHWDGSKPADLYLFAWPDAEQEKNHLALGIPKLGSLIITHDPDGLFPGLKDFPREERPPVWPVFWSFRVMVAIGLAMVAIGLVAGWLWWRGRLFDARWFLKPVGYAWPLGFVGDRPPAVGRARHPAYGRRGLARQRRGGRGVAGAVRRGVHGRVRRRRLVHPPARREGTAAGSAEAAALAAGPAEPAAVHGRRGGSRRRHPAGCGSAAPGRTGARRGAVSTRRGPREVVR